MPRGQAIQDDLARAREDFRRFNHPGYGGVAIAKLEERNVVVDTLSIMHDTAKTRGNCHPDYVIFRASYEFRVDYEVFYRKQPGNEPASYIVTGNWQTVTDEQWVDTIDHCEHGLEDLPPVPDDYCMVRSGDRVLYEGPLAGVEIRTWTKRTAAASGSPPEQSGPPQS